MAVAEEDTSLIDGETEGTGKATNTENSGSDGACQARPNRGRNDDCKHYYHGERHKRTDLRTADAHYSWREVYRLCSVGGARP